ncbi:ABC transporter ATP-binding protein [Peptococcus simiae]|uniref:Quaternary amine transport ATP-binding protein n=1 Tax=Peptococcus simiae TaxID=1643805 RepID=A0ABW9H0C4_9FIRM
MIEFKNVKKVYPGNSVAVKDVNLTLEDGSFNVFIGTSGSGKTTCLRMINRMIDPSEGAVLINGKSTKEINEVALRRQIGYVIQQIGLMPHMTIYENIIMVPKLLKWPEEKMREVALRLMKRVNLPESYLDLYPNELSGGQQQRVGVIRALAADQEIILMDEPFGALDPITRDALQNLVKRLQQEMGKTVVFVTHDMDEALTLADQIVIMDHGEVVQKGTPNEILANPANDFVTDLIGEDRLRQARFNTATVREIMYTKPISINPEASLRDAVLLMREKRVDSLFVTDDKGVLIGYLDIFDVEHVRQLQGTVRDYMKDCYYLPDTEVVREAIYVINTLGFKNLAVVDGQDRLVGIITRAIVVDLIYDSMWGDDEDCCIGKDIVQMTSADDDSGEEA